MRKTARRGFLATAGTLAVAAAVPGARAQMVRTPLNNMPEVIKRLVGTRPVTKGRVKLDVPPLVENGHLVPLAVRVESAMTAADHVRAIYVFTERNPLPEMAVFRLGPRAGRASVSTRVRLADTQNVVAIAEMNDGSFWSDSAYVIVTLAACLEELPS